MRRRPALRFLLAISACACSCATVKTAHEGISVPEGMVLVEGGKFRMGDQYGDGWALERPVHDVAVGDFLLGAREVTVGEFRAFLRETGYRTYAQMNADRKLDIIDPASKKTGGIKGASWDNPLFAQTEASPVTMVTWNDAVAYCNWRSEKEGLAPCYTVDGGEVACDFEAEGYRLPTEAEWEFAARGRGKRVRFGNGKDMADTGEINFDGRLGGHFRESDAYSRRGEYRGRTVPAGSGSPNALGLYHMSGNAAEWCWDLKYYYPGFDGAGDGQKAGPSYAADRMIRGGGWSDGPLSVSATARYAKGPGYCRNDLGFRLARGLRARG